MSDPVLSPPGPSLAAVKHRFRLDIAYDGTEFSGWAVQPGRRTVAGVVQQALSTVLRVPSVALTVAGRTDSGVHAIGQVAHVDLADPPDGSLLSRLAGVLPPDVRVLRVASVPDEFDARFAGLWRRYVYRISDHPGGASPLHRRFVLDHRRPLEVAAMDRAASRLLGLNDFAAFCRRRDSGTTVRDVQRFDVARVDGEITCTVQADAFCHSMVRSLVGALLAVGDGRRPPEWPARLLSNTERSGEIAVAPAHGLTLVEVGYPPDDRLAERTEITRARRA